MVKSMYAAVAGLKTHQSKMDVIGNNIANVNTYGYKKERASFADTYYSTSQGAANASNNQGGSNPSQIGYGVQMSGVTAIVTTGGSAITDNPTDVAITGNGYFLVGAYNENGYTTSSDSNGINGQGALTSLYLTRVGMFTFDGQGSLVDSNGNYVYGYASARGVQAMKTASTAATDTTPGSWTYTVGTTNYTVSATTAVDGTITGYNVYEGAAGATADPVLVLKASDFDPDNCDNLYLLPTTGGDAQYNDPKAYTVDQNTGYIKGIATGTVVNSTDSLSALQIPRTYTVNGYVDKDGNPLTVNLYGKNDSVQVRVYTATTDTTTNVTTYTEDTANSPMTITGEDSWDNAVAMKLSSISIGTDGTISGVNGADKAIMTLGKIAVADVPNPTALEAQGNCYYMAKANTGVINACNPGESSTGALKSGALEMSNVDLSTEFTDMITTQRGYQANSRIITVTDTMLEELVNLKR